MGLLDDDGYRPPFSPSKELLNRWKDHGRGSVFEQPPEEAFRPLPNESPEV